MYVEENFVTSRCIVKQRTMSFRSILQDMKGEFGSMSRKGFEVKLGHGFRSRSQRVVQDSLVSADALKQSCWANMPPELLRDVLMRIEVSEISWPLRRHVVACAGVCRSWREIMNEIVKTPEASGKLTFPISLKQVRYPQFISICDQISSLLIANLKSFQVLETFAFEPNVKPKCTAYH